MTAVARHVPDSIKEIFRKGYSKFVRPRLPAKRGTNSLANGVLVSRRDAKVLDAVIGDPTYEYFNARALRERVHQGDTVVIVGGGMGVTAVVAARQVGPSGTIHVYEAGAETYEQLNETVTRNGVDDLVETHHAVVGTEGAKLRSDPGDTKTVAPGDLPAADVLEMDCEGAEADILADLAIRPEMIIVEGHTHYGVPPDELRDLLTGMDYKIVKDGGNPEMVYHLVGIRQ